MGLPSKRHRRLWIGIAVLVLLSPLGLLVPALFKAGGAWGEWGADEIGNVAGYVPEGIRRLGGLWKSPFPGYAVGGWDGGVKSYLAYILTGVIGVLSIAVVSYLIGKRLTKKK